MTDVRTLLRASAPSPHRDLDVGAIVARARRRSPWRRVGPGLAAIAALTGVAGGAGTGILSPAGSPQRLETGPAPAVEVRETPPDLSIAVADRTGGPALAGSSTSPPAGRTSSTAPASGAATGGRPQPTEHGDGGAEPVAQHEGCATEGTEDLEAGPTGFGFSTGGRDYPECSYIATREGGYIANGRWRIEIEKPDGMRYELTSSQMPECADPGFWITPGDRVTAILVIGVGDLSPDRWYVKVGSNYGCAGS